MKSQKKNPRKNKTIRKEINMPYYDFLCKKCNKKYVESSPYDATGKYKKVACPECGSKKKEKLISSSTFNFANPVGTDRWNNTSTGHDYRFKHNIPKVQQERAMAEALSHMGTDPYKDNSEKDIQLDTGVHDAQSRPGLS